MPKCYQLIGVPGSGKTTWIRNQVQALGLVVVSTIANWGHPTEEKGFKEIWHAR